MSEVDDILRVMTRKGHPGGALSTYRILRAFAPEFRPTDLILSSKGHDAAAFLRYDVERGALPEAWLTRYRAVNGYPGHPERGVTPGAVVSTGSLGMGLSKAVGLAWADQSRRVICVVGDGECQEGQVWEAALAAARLRLGNLVVLLDHNGAQSENGPLLYPQPLQPDMPFKAAAWSVLPCDPPNYVIPPATGWPICVMVHGRKELPHSLSVRGPLATAYGQALNRAFGLDDRLVALHADLAYDHGLDIVEAEHVDRVLNVGISEQQMVSMAVGLAAAGWHPVCHTFARFYLRAAEQIYDALAEPGLAIRFVAALAGPLPIGPGPSHEIDPVLESTVFRCPTWTPREPDQVAFALAGALTQPRSTYLRLVAQPELA